MSFNTFILHIMCGIVGYIGKKEAYPILINGLHRLEYRGYDSAGVGIVDADNRIKVYKTKGKVKDLENLADSLDHKGNIGIAHTRWATHGEPNTINAHPHISQDKHIVMVHNGIIENYEELKSELLRNGYEFKSDTDTEVLVQYISKICNEKSLPIQNAVIEALKAVKGSYAIAVYDDRTPDTIIAARKNSPLAIGIDSNDGYLLASDATPLLSYTKQVIYLDNEEIAILKNGFPIEILKLNGERVNHEIQTIELSEDQIDKSGYEHYMLKEIHQQPVTLRKCMENRVLTDEKKIRLNGFEQYKEKFTQAGRIIIIACGTSWHAGLVGKYIFEEYAGVPCHVEYASEFRYRKPVILPSDVIIAISQSGETADTLAALELAKSAGAFLYSICNVPGSSIVRMCDSGTYTTVGPEIGVASTKAFTGQVLVITLLAISLAKEKGSICNDKYEEIISELAKLPQNVEQILDDENNIINAAKLLASCHSILYLGRCYQYPIALEGALKMKEISYIHAEGYPTGEMKHGPIALIDPETPSVVLAPKNGEYEKTISNIQEIKARKGKVIAIGEYNDDYLRNESDAVLYVPHVHPVLMPIITVIPLQLLSYHVAIMKGCDVDQPRNLAKSVTVE